MTSIFGSSSDKLCRRCCCWKTGEFYQSRANWGEQIHNVPIHNMKCQQYRRWRYADASGRTQTGAVTFIEPCTSEFIRLCLQDSVVWAEKMHPQNWIRTTKNVMKSIYVITEQKQEVNLMYDGNNMEKKQLSDIGGHFCCSIRRMKDCLIQGRSLPRLKNISPMH